MMLPVLCCGGENKYKFTRRKVKAWIDNGANEFLYIYTSIRFLQKYLFYFSFYQLIIIHNILRYYYIIIKHTPLMVMAAII